MRKITKLMLIPALLMFWGLSNQIFAQGETCATAVAVTPGTYTADGPATGAGAANICYTSATNADWYSYTATADGIIDVVSCLGGADTRLSVYTGACGALVCYANTDDVCEMTPGSSTYAAALYGIPVVNGTTYYIEWDDRWSGAGFDWTLTFIVPGSTCADAEVISEGSFTCPGPVAGFGGAANLCYSGATDAYWYEYTPAVDGNATASSCMGGADTRLSVYTGACGTLTCFVSNDDFCDLGTGNNWASEVTFAVTAGTTYLIEWDDNWDASGFTWTLNNAPSVTVPAPWTEPFTTTSLPADWINSGAESWLISTGAAYGAAAAGDHTTGGGTNYAWIDGSGGVGVNELITPVIDVSALTDPFFSFWYFSNNTDVPGDNNTLDCEIAIDGGGWTNIFSYAGDDAAWQTFGHSLASYTITTGVQFKFIVTGTASTEFYNDILVDDVTVDEAPAPAIAVAPASPYDYVYVQLGNTNSETFTVSNTGGGTINVTGGAIAGDAAFTISASSIGNLPPDNVFFTVDFAPTVLGVVNATLTITHSLGTTDILLSGEGVAVIPNDDCVNAIFVNTFPQTVTGTTKGAEIDCPGVLDWNAVWYEIDLPYADNNFNVSYCGTALMPTGGIVYIPDCASCGSFVVADNFAFDPCTAPDPNALQMDFLNIAGPGTIMFPAYGGDPGIDFTVTFDVTNAAILPPGADCANAIVATFPADLPYSDLSQTNCGLGDTYNATCLGSYDSGEDIIYRIDVTADVTVDITMDPKGTTYGGMLIADDCPDVGTCLDFVGTSSGAAKSLLGIALVAGNSYYIMIDTWAAPNCIPDFDLTITTAAAPVPGDDCTLPIVVGQGIHNAPQQPVWYEYTTTGNGYLEISSLGNGVDTRLYVYSDCVPTLVDGNDDYWGYPPGESWVGIPVSAGETYYILWGDNYSTAPITFTILETNTASDWTGGVDNDWWNAGNWTNGVGGVMTDVTIAAGLTNYPTIGTWSAAVGNLTVQSGASGDGSLLDGGFLTVDGTLNVERYIGGMAYHGFSPSVGGELIDIFHLAGGQPDVYLYENIEATYDYTELWTLGTPLNTFQGYMVWVNGSPWTFTETGTLNSGAFGSADNIFSSTGDGTRGWNLLGNPYTSALDWQSAYTASGVNVDATVYVNNPAIGQWATWSNGSGGLNGGSQYVAMGQGFFVHATAAGVGTFTVDNTDRVHNGVAFLKSEISNKVALQVEGNGYTDETAIIFNNDATIGFDANFDAYKLMSDHPGVPSLYSIANTNLALNALPETNWVQLGFSVKVDGEYTISAIEVNDIGDVVLEDTFTGEMTDLNVGSYTFTASTGDAANRFIVHFSPLGLGANINEATNIYSHNKTIYINVPESTIGHAVVYDMMGKEVANSSINGTFNTITLEKSAYYVVKVVSNESIITEKVFIK